MAVGTRRLDDRQQRRGRIGATYDRLSATMSMASRILTLLCALAACVAAAPGAPAVAQSGGFDVTGDWRFEADACAGDGGSLTPLSGRMTIQPAGDGLIARFFVRQGQASAIQVGDVAVADGEVVITSEVIRAWTLGEYFPDNFRLTPVSPNRMEGSLLSIVDCQAIFERLEHRPGLV